MPRDGNGTYSLPLDWEVDEANSIKVRSDRMMQQEEDIGDALTFSIAKDGQTLPTANLPMNSKKHTGVANASASDEYAVVGQIQDQSYIYGSTAGSANTYTFSPAVAITSYTAGQRFSVKINATNTGASTINVSSLGAKSIKKDISNDVEAGDLVINSLVELVYDGTNFQLINSKISDLQIVLLSQFYA